eukprot:scaffold576622_cov14-Prasinocladus_malaysianus.AAC.1
MENHWFCSLECASRRPPQKDDMLFCSFCSNRDDMSSCVSEKGSILGKPRSAMRRTLCGPLHHVNRI